MPPVVKRILVQSVLTAAILGLIGLGLAEMVFIWAAGNSGRPSAADLNPPPPESLRYRIPLTLAAAGFVFVAVGEWMLARVRAWKEAAKPAAARQDTAEHLLNELLAQAEAKAAEPGPGAGVQDSGQPKPEEPEKKAD
jgi:hypothetical protein